MGFRWGVLKKSSSKGELAEKGLVCKGGTLQRKRGGEGMGLALDPLLRFYGSSVTGPFITAETSLISLFCSFWKVLR